MTPSEILVSRVLVNDEFETRTRNNVMGIFLRLTIDVIRIVSVKRRGKASQMYTRYVKNLERKLRNSKRGKRMNTYDCTSSAMKPCRHVDMRMWGKFVNLHTEGAT